jgi:hypothetical protein
VDEETANIYQWKPEEDQPYNEVLIDSLLVPPIPQTEYPSIEINAARWPWVEYTVYRGASTSDLFGMSVIRKRFIADTYAQYYYILAKDFGLFDYSYAQLVYFRDHLGNEFSREPVFVNSPPEPELPQAAALGRNYPNPFNPSTTIPFELSTSAHVRLEVYDMLGRRVALLIDEPRRAGDHTARFEAGNLPSGVYLARMQTGNEVLTQKMILVK